MLDVTVCILSYNRPAYLRESLLSVLSQTRLPERIAIYDNGSDKPVRENIEDLLGDRVRWVGAEANHPFIWNFNRAMQDCETRYVMMLHDDDRLCPDFLDRQIGLLKTNEDLVAVSCNGYFIDEAGNRTGGTLVPYSGTDAVELFTCAGQVAIKYAANSCIPMSPAVYRTGVARTVRIREEYGKVCDAVLFCDLAEAGTIACQTKPAYECRAHAEQDSKHFPFDLLNRLEEFCWSRRCENEAERNRLHALLLKQHAARNLRQILLALRQGRLLRIASLLGDRKFKIGSALRVIRDQGQKIVFRKR